MSEYLNRQDRLADLDRQRTASEVQAQATADLVAETKRLNDLDVVRAEMEHERDPVRLARLARAARNLRGHADLSFAVDLRKS